MMPGQHGTPLKDYTQALVTQLRLRNVPGVVIGQVVAEVESHVRETGEDPVEAFGQPGSYSAQFAGRRRLVGGAGWLSLADVTLTMALAGVVVALMGVFNLGKFVNVTENIVAWVVLLVMFALVVGRIDIALADRETRTIPADRRALGKRAVYGLRFLAFFAMLQLGSEIGARMPNEPVLISLPRWSLVLVGLAATSASLWVSLRSDRIVDPRGSAMT